MSLALVLTAIADTHTLWEVCCAKMLTASDERCFICYLADCAAELA